MAVAMTLHTELLIVTILPYCFSPTSFGDQQWGFPGFSLKI